MPRNPRENSFNEEECDRVIDQMFGPYKRNFTLFEVYVNLTDVKDKPELLALLTEQNLSYREITTKPEVVLVVVAAKQLGTLQDIAVPATFQFLFLENS